MTTLGFPFFNQTLVESMNNRIEFCCRHSRHKQNTPQFLPPRVFRLPDFLPLSLFIGATPAKAAICSRFSCPSSGISASKVTAVTFPTPLQEVMQAMRDCHSSFLVDQMVNLNFHLLDLFIDVLDMRCDARLDVCRS